MGDILGKSGVEKALQREMDVILKRREPAFVTYRDEGGEELVLFAEPLASRPVLYLFGGGHVSLQICPLARRVGLPVSFNGTQFGRLVFGHGSAGGIPQLE